MLRLLTVLLILAATAPFASAQMDQTPWYLEVEWELGSEDSGEYFTNLNFVLPRSDNKFYLVERGQPRVQVFSKDGERLSSFGSEGRGPGEFTRIHSAILLPDQRVLIHDRDGGRLSEFDDKGVFQRHIQLPTVSTMLMWLADYNAELDRVAFLRENPERDENGPLVYWADLESGEVSEGVFAPSSLLDVDDPVYAFSAKSIITYKTGRWQHSGEPNRLVIFPQYYSGAWASVAFQGGNTIDPQIHQVGPDETLLHATKLDLTDEEWKANRGKYNMALGSYGPDGVNFADIHNHAQAMVSLPNEGLGIFFASEESGMDGIWIDAFDASGNHTGRHQIVHSLEVHKDAYNPSIIGSNGVDEVYFGYYAPDFSPRLVKAKLVPRD